MGAMHLKGRQALVLLLKGPMKASRLAKKVGMSGGYAVQKTMLAHDYVQVTNKGLMLTKKGLVQATQWEYALKNQNEHPDQLEPVVIYAKDIVDEEASHEPTLLEKALSYAPAPPKPSFGDQEIELGLAWIEGKVSAEQIEKAIGAGHGHGSTKAAQWLKCAWEQGMIGRK